MTEKRTIRHGPFKGYVSSVTKEHIPGEFAGPDSRDFRFNPTLGKWLERGGSAVLGDTFGALTGLLTHASSETLRTRQIFEFPAIKDQAGTVQFADHYPSYGALYSQVFTPSVTDKGGLYFRSSNTTASNQEPVKSWSATTYPTTAREGVKSFIKALPTWHQKANAGSAFLSRMGSNHQTAGAWDRQWNYAGARRMLISGNWLYTPGLQSDGRRWNMLFNDSSSSPTRKERHYPIGITPPLFPAFIKVASLPTETSSVKSWKQGDRFFISLCWIFEDGTWSMPYIPSPKVTGTGTTPVTGGMNNNFGVVTIATTVPGNYYEYIVWENIPKPPPGVVKKALLRSTKVDSSVGDFFPAITNDDGTLNLRVTAIIDASVTSYKDYHGNDLDLLLDPQHVRADIIEPPRARYIGAFDGRVGIGYTAQNPRAIYLAPTGVTLSNDVTADDDESMGTTTYGSNRAYVARIDGSGNLQLRRVSGAYPSAPATTTIAMAGLTIQELVDAINETTPASTAGEWRAQLAPGCDGSLLATFNMQTTIGFDFGDDGLVNDATVGNFVCTSQALPGVLFLSQGKPVTRLNEPDRLGFWFSSMPPEAQAKGSGASCNFWIASNYRQPPDADSGVYQGLAALSNGAVLFYSKKVWLFRNTRDGRTGRDEDYRFDLLSNDGCIAWDSIVEFNNAVGWLSAKGYKVTGGEPGDERLISGAIFDPNTNLGVSEFRIAGNLTYEVEKCVASTAADLDDARFHAHRFGHVLTIKYRSSSSASVPDIEQEYDFSEGSGSGGLAELFRPDGAPYGWSAPFRRPGEAMGEYRNSTGVVKLHAIETAGTGGPGRIDQIDTGYQDNGTAISALLYTKMDDMGEPRRRHRDRRFTVKFRSPTGNSMTVTHSRDRLRNSATTYTLENTGTAELATQTKRVQLEGQSPARVTEFKFASTRVTAGPAEIFLIERECKLLDTPLDQAG